LTIYLGFPQAHMLRRNNNCRFETRPGKAIMALLTADKTIGTGEHALAARIYRDVSAAGTAPLVLHMHAGAFVTGSVETGRPIAQLLAEAGAVVVSAEYPLAPAHPFPKAVQSLFHVLTWLHANRPEGASKKSALFVAGEEAGGNLAAALALMARDQQRPALAGQILLSPMLDPSLATCSMREANTGDADCPWVVGWNQYLGTADKAAHPYAAPFNSSRLAGAAPALIVTAEDDHLRDESLRYAQRLRESGVAVREHVLTETTHWPCALTDTALTDRPWAGAVRDRFRSFLLKPASHSRSAGALAFTQA
jgi:acetyl esterase